MVPAACIIEPQRSSNEPLTLLVRCGYFPARKSLICRSACRRIVSERPGSLTTRDIVRAPIIVDMTTRARFLAVSGRILVSWPAMMSMSLVKPSVAAHHVRCRRIWLSQRRERPVGTPEKDHLCEPLKDIQRPLHSLRPNLQRLSSF